MTSVVKAGVDLPSDQQLLEVGGLKSSVSSAANSVKAPSVREVLAEKTIDSKTLGWVRCFFFCCLVLMLFDVGMERRKKGDGIIKQMRGSDLPLSLLHTTFLRLIFLLFPMGKTKLGGATQRQYSTNMSVSLSFCSMNELDGKRNGRAPPSNGADRR